ncbi:alpha-amylase family glycosyl hydrolase [Marinoscillum pacificum]|uniref:alpha-amylase family glycosyl hydrolase n=1 Tax=Marinoscillum pacificum TaxID=392723 RepID=UPI002158788C|nr:alpha-amylase family glycosyl hydrolase [Marinoscillum pacificum]
MKKLELQILVFALFLSACTSTSTMNELPNITHPEWVKDASIYEVNIRQFTPEGTFKAFESHIPRLKELGVDILWLMPIHPIGEINRKGTLGSYYAVKDYREVNPEFGTNEDFQHLVDLIHQHDMKVIIDWVGNHSSWDNELTKSHPEWYLHDYKGDFIPPIGWDWSDVIVFDYEQKGLRDYMIESLKYWVEEFDIDGYRCDVAGYVPTDFWLQSRRSLESVKPVFMLAEWDDRAMHYAFDMSYAWELEETMHAIAKGNKNATALNAYIAKMINSTRLTEIKMTFTSNHDKNSWEGTVFDRFGLAAQNFAAFTYMVEGMPLIYSGQEVGLKQSLSFFEKDQIAWGDHPFNSLYARLNNLKKDNKALWNGEWGGRMLPLKTNKPEQVNVIFREKDGNKVVALFNASDKEVVFSVEDKVYSGEYKSFNGRNTVELTEDQQFTLGPWGYQIYTAK